MDLSIIILTLNSKRILEQCLKSIQQYTQGISYELIVVDNGSDDGTQETLRTRYQKVKLIENRVNLGFSRANNQGLKAAKGRYALILNDDTFIKGDSFTTIVQFMDENPEIGICGPRLLNFNGSIQMQGSVASFHKWPTDKPTQVNLIIGACMFIRKKVLDKIGLFDENLFFYNDDLDLCKRALKAGYKVVYSPIANVYHYGGFSSKKTVNSSLMIEGLRGGLYYCLKHYGIVAYHAYRLMLFIGILAMIPLSLFNKEKLKAYFQVIKIIKNQQIVSKIASL